MQPLLQLLYRIHPEWDYLPMQTRRFVLNTLIDSRRGSFCVVGAYQSLPGGTHTIPQFLRDVHVSAASHDTIVFTRRGGRKSVKQQAESRLGRVVDTRNPIIGSRGGCLHTLESLIVF